ncbi:MAG: VacJ family lipoprotein [Gammaproteobacteria bacterium]|nr:MAG: VacJ family lipoprotein [Gammaproteobacteria bacterium]
MPTTLRVSTLSLAFLLLCGCASQAGTKRDPRDPWEPMNRATYRFNDKFDRAIAKPVARSYRRVTPQFVQTGVSNFLDNLQYPVVMVNDLLQGQFTPFAQDTGRLLLNTTLGIGGLFDPASAAGLDKNDREFGQTFGKWGIKPGPYLVIPFLGPSDVRDGFGLVANTYADPRVYINNDAVKYGLWVVHAVDIRAHLLDVEGAMQGAYDPYAFVRNAYLERRQFKVTGGDSGSEEEQEEKLLEESGEGNEKPQPQKPPQPPPPPPH